MKKMGDKIRFYREHNNIKKSELARMIGVSPAYITMLENGKKENPSDEIMFKLSNALGVDHRDIFETTYDSESEMLEEQWKEVYQNNIEMFDYTFINVKDMIDALIHSSSFKNEFKLDVNTLGENELNLLKNKIYDDIGWICYKMNKDR